MELADNAPVNAANVVAPISPTTRQSPNLDFRANLECALFVLYLAITFPLFRRMTMEFRGREFRGREFRGQYTYLLCAVGRAVRVKYTVPRISRTPCPQNSAEISIVAPDSPLLWPWISSSALVPAGNRFASSGDSILIFYVQ